MVTKNTVGLLLASLILASNCTPEQGDSEASTTASGSEPTVDSSSPPTEPITAVVPSAPDEPIVAATTDPAVGNGSGDASAATVGEAENAQPQTNTAPPTTAPSVSAEGHGPLSEAAREIFWSSPEDPPAENLDATRPDLEGRHYLYSDEANLHLFFERTGNLGGGYAGVGSDQAYLFIGSMRPNLAWLTDYDPWIKWLHWSYFAFFDLSDDIDTFLAYWDRETEDASIEVLREYYADHAELEEIVFVFDEANRAVHRRLRRLRARMNALDVVTFINDAETYAFVRTMIRNGRVRPMLANLLDDEALVGIGDAGRQLGVPLRVMYLSNAEDYWSYPDQFRANMAALHFDNASLILRANASKPENSDYRYNIQSALNFRQWLAQPYVRRIRNIWDRETIEGPEHIPVSFIDEPPFERD